MHPTAWARSSLPSDRLPPARPKQPLTPVKGKGKQAAHDPPKSKEVRRLERLREDLRKAAGRERDPRGGCFCQARVHTLSSYTPICRKCGLILCVLQLPQYACPHCASVLLTPDALNGLVASLESQIAVILAREEEERERAAQEARAAAGAFPTLSASAPNSGPSAQPAANQTHRVLSLDSKTKKVTVSSYSPAPAISRPASRDSVLKDEVDEEQGRVPPPPSEVPFVNQTRDVHTGPWANLRGGSATYVSSPEAAATGSGSSGRSGKKGRDSGSGGKTEKVNAKT